MEREYQIQEGYLIVKAGKELDHHRAEHIREILNRVGRERMVKHIIFDFSGTGFMDSSGVGMIISRYRDLSMRGGTVCAAGVCPAVEKLFYVSGIHKIIRVYPEVEDVFNEQK